MKDFLSTGDVAERLGMSTRHVSRLMREGKLPHVKRGRLLKVPITAWNAWLTSQATEAMAAIGGSYAEPA